MIDSGAKQCAPPTGKAMKMKDQLEKRLGELRGEFESGQKMLADLENKKNELQTTMLRISGAIQVIEELLAKEGPQDEGQ